MKIIRKIQKIFITAALFVLYIFGFGSTLIFVMIFNRSLLGKKEEEATFWKTAEGYEANFDECLRGS